MEAQPKFKVGDRVICTIETYGVEGKRIITGVHTWGIEKYKSHDGYAYALENHAGLFLSTELEYVPAAAPELLYDQPQPAVEGVQDVDAWLAKERVGAEGAAIIRQQQARIAQLEADKRVLVEALREIIGIPAPIGNGDYYSGMETGIASAQDIAREALESARKG